MIDWSQIKQLEEDVGAEDLAEVVEIFLEEVDEAVDALRGLEGMSGEAMAPALHFLKGSAANLGFADFASICSDGEHKADEGNSADVDLSAVVTSYDASKAEFMKEAVNHCSVKF